MTQEEIKKHCEIAYSQIKSAESVLEEMREICKHPETIETNYSWRVGSIAAAIICSDCDKLIKYL